MSAAPVVPILSRDEALSKLAQLREGRAPTAYAMYSSLYGGVVTESALMVIPIDDHMCHRGHAVFDTATVTEGVLYNADAHIDRFLRSAQLARIQHSYTHDDIKHIVIATARASGQRSMEIRYWLSVGPGDFSFLPHGCIAPALYCVAVKSFFKPRAEGSAEVLVPDDQAPMKTGNLAAIKSTNYLANVLLSLTAQDHGGSNGIWVGKDGFIKEGPVHTVVLLDRTGVVRSPPPGDVLQSCTMLRIADLCRASGYTVEHAPITPDEIFQAKELLLVGGDKYITSVAKLNGRRIGDGVPGPFCQFIQSSLDGSAVSSPSDFGLKILD